MSTCLDNFTGIELVISDETFEKIAIKAESENKGARYLEKIRANLVREIIELLKKYEESDQNKYLKFSVNYDELLDKFELKEQ